MTETTVLLTRPEPDSHAFLDALAARLGRRPAAVVSPLVEIRPHGKVPPLAGYEAVFVTSRNAVRVAGAALAGRRVLTVGEATAAAARDAGAEAACLGQDLDDLLDRLPPLAGPVVHLRGRETRGDLAGALASRGIAADEAVIYDAAALALNDDARRLLAEPGRVLAPVFSPRSMRLLVAAAGDARPEVVALSPAVAEVAAPLPVAAVAREPTRAAMLDALLAAMDSTGLAHAR